MPWSIGQGIALSVRRRYPFRFIPLIKSAPVSPALSGKTLECDGAGRCVAGCQRP